jgi:hypothetical protein
MKRGLLIFGLVLLLALLPCFLRAELVSGNLDGRSVGQQDEIEKTILDALEMLRKGDTTQAAYLLAEAVMMIKSSGKLSVSQLLLCEEINGYRDYVQREGNTLKSGEPFLLYIEPAGYQIKKEDGEYKIWVSEDASIVNSAGENIFQQTNWVEYQKGFASPVIPFYITNRVTDIPPGKYTFKFTIKDKYKNSFLEQSFEFVVE